MYGNFTSFKQNFHFCKIRSIVDHVCLLKALFTQNACFIVSWMIAPKLSPSILTFLVPFPLKVINTWSLSISDRLIMSRLADTSVSSKTFINSFLLIVPRILSQPIAYCLDLLPTFLEPYFCRISSIVTSLLWDLTWSPKCHVHAFFFGANLKPSSFSLSFVSETVKAPYPVPYQFNFHVV